MFLVYANVSSLESRGLFTCLYTYAQISQIKTAGIVFYLEFKNDYTLQSMLVCFHVATIPFSWKFGFDKLSKYDELC